MAATFDDERALLRRGLWPVAGVDEAGRGPLAGPVSAAAVILDPDDIPVGLDDSKALNATSRDQLFEDILARALAVSIAFSPAEEIDRLNIRIATHTAMRRALGGLAIRVFYALVDGNDLPSNLPCSGRTIIKGDASSASIAAASIVAKVTRDRLMARVALLHPAYGFNIHMGYGTPAHLKAIADHGPCPYHRKTFAPVREEIARRAR